MFKSKTFLLICLTLTMTFVLTSCKEISTVSEVSIPDTSKNTGADTTSEPNISDTTSDTSFELSEPEESQESQEYIPTVDYNTLDEKGKRIFDYYKLMDAHDYEGWLLYWCDNNRESGYEFIMDYINSGETYRANDGPLLLNINTVRVLSIEKNGTHYMPIIKELEPYFESDDLNETYTIGLDITVYVNDDYYHDGINYCTVILVKDGETWNIGAITVESN